MNAKNIKWPTTTELRQRIIDGDVLKKLSDEKHVVTQFHLKDLGKRARERDNLCVLVGVDPLPFESEDHAVRVYYANQFQRQLIPLLRRMMRQAKMDKVLIVPDRVTRKGSTKISRKQPAVAGPGIARLVTSDVVAFAAQLEKAHRGMVQEARRMNALLEQIINGENLHLRNCPEEVKRLAAMGAIKYRHDMLKGAGMMKLHNGNPVSDMFPQLPFLPHQTFDPKDAN